MQKIQNSEDVNRFFDFLDTQLKLNEIEEAADRKKDIQLENDKIKFATQIVYIKDENLKNAAKLKISNDILQ